MPRVLVAMRSVYVSEDSPARALIGKLRRVNTYEP